MENTRMKTPKIIVGALVVYCIVVLLIGIANAADLTRPATGDHFTGRAGQFAPQKIIGRLLQKGVDVTGALTALQKGDTAAVKQWLMSYFEAHRGETAHIRPSPDFQSILTRLEGNGVDVIEAKTALQNGDTGAVKEWLEAYRQTQQTTMAQGNGHFGPQKIIGRLEQRGVDVTEVKATLQNHDMASVKAWLDAYIKAHKDAKVACHPVNHLVGKNGRQS
jgi:SOS response regulatory protein OraA/RecX